jgi:N-acetyl-anhydromuramyl-L-alanine amidase AmpD
MTDSRTINKIIIHVADTPESMDIGVNEIRSWHTAKGWNDVGYHYVIRRDGTIEVGRQESKIGAHCRGYNWESIGICMVGRNMFTDIQWDSLAKLVKSLDGRYGATVHGHRDFDKHKTCPNFDVGDWYESII